MLELIIGYDVLCADICDGARIVNICARLGISYHQLTPDGEHFTIRLGLIASLRLREFCKSNGIDIKLLYRRGLPVSILRLMCRPGIALGVLLCWVTLSLCGRLIWDIRIEGNKNVPAEVIEETLRRCGVSVGSDKSQIDVDTVQNRFLVISDEISWISVNLVGNVAEVEVRERAWAEESPDYACSNLVATQNGKILEFFQVRGNIAVNIGDAVSRGQLLVGGVYGDEQSALRFVRSKGQVMALCDREYTVSVPLKFDKKVYSGNKKIKKSLIFFEKEVKLFVNSGNLYASCDIIEDVKYLDLFGLGKLPFGICTYEYAEYTMDSGKRSESEAYEQALFELWQKYYADVPDGTVATKRITGQLTENEYVLKAMLGSIENIAQEKQVEINITG